MGNLVGIDLGTTNSVAAFKLAEVEVVTADDNTPPDRKLTRSVVAYEQGILGIGEKAYNQLRVDPENVIISIKRLMGRGFSDPVVQEQLSRFGYKVTQSTQGTENSISVWLGGQEYQPEDISAEILKKVVQNAQSFQSESGQKSTISQAVVTIPAYFDDKQRHATQTAATKAGLTLLELLPEPTAAAISYGFKPNTDNVQTILVYDFGGGTFDSSLITAAGNQFIEAGKAGDLWLGGDDIDNLIIQFVKEQVAQEEKLDNIDGLIAQMPHYQRVRFMGDLKMAVERAKVDLSNATSTHIIPSTPLLDDLGMAVPIDVEFTRQQFEEMIAPLVDRSIAICQNAIKYSDYPLEMVDAILLVGGSSQIPLVQRKVTEAFGADKVVVHPRPMYAVAEGAAIVAAGLTEKVGTVSRDYFIELVDEPRHILAKSGDNLPVKVLRTFRTQADGQRLIHFKFFSPDRVRQDIDRIRKDDPIGEMWMSLDRYYPRGTEILVTLEIDERIGYLQATAALKNDPAIRVSCSFSRGGIDEDISRTVERLIAEMNEAANLTEKGVNEANRIAGEVVQSANQIYWNGKLQPDRLDSAQKKLRELEAFASEDYDKAKIYAGELDFIAQTCSFLVSPSQLERQQAIVKQLRHSIDTHNLSLMQKASEDAQRELENLPEEVQIILISREAISRAHAVSPATAKSMSAKLAQMVAALERGDNSTANQLWRELQPDVRHWIDRELPTGNIVTGLTK